MIFHNNVGFFRDFNFLLVQYGIAVNYVGSGTATWSNNDYSYIQNNPIYTIQSGYFNSSSFYTQASRSYLWSGTTHSGTNAYDLYYNSSNVGPAFIYNRQVGLSVRCITQHFYIIIQKKNQNSLLFFFSYYSFFVGLSFTKESPNWAQSEAPVRCIAQRTK